MTEKEAGGKLCVEGRALLNPISDSAINTNYSDPQTYTPCQASICMKWRWLDAEKTSGYCGLAGKPEHE